MRNYIPQFYVDVITDPWHIKRARGAREDEQAAENKETMNVVKNFIWSA